MLGKSSSPFTFYVPVALRISSILCPSEPNIEGKLVHDYVHTSNSHKLSETRSSVSEIVYILTMVGSFFRELGFHTSCLCIGLNFPTYIDKLL